ncbi:hypothetical protein [Bacillus sp. Marseille-P3800]|uniref:hypothetical protein n=1 Tax=Bacillus sp. Marseille-P3800 TaxID=2014782 RepID=UPI000C078B6B|nr:hypothetical protein [Bacillus sp. Marseille-P3800]
MNENLERDPRLVKSEINALNNKIETENFQRQLDIEEKQIELFELEHGVTQFQAKKLAEFVYTSKFMAQGEIAKGRRSVQDRFRSMADLYDSKIDIVEHKMTLEKNKIPWKLHIGYGVGLLLATALGIYF